jgi:hypothetical protein
MHGNMNVKILLAIYLQFTRQDNSLLPGRTQLPKNCTICSAEVAMQMKLTESHLRLQLWERNSNVQENSNAIH